MSIKSSPLCCIGHPKNHTMGLRALSKLFFNSDSIGTVTPHFHGKPVPMRSHPLGENLLPDMKPKPPLTELQTISLSPVTGLK